MGAQVNEVLIDHVAARLDGCGLHRRSNPSPALPNSTLRTRSQTTPVSGEHAHAHRPIELAGVRGCSTTLPGHVDKPVATHRAHTGALVAPIEHPRFARRSRSRTLFSRLHAARELTFIEPSRRQADSAALWYQLTGLARRRRRTELNRVRY